MNSNSIYHNFNNSIELNMMYKKSYIDFQKTIINIHSERYVKKSSLKNKKIKQIIYD